MIDFSFTPEQQAIRDTIFKLCSRAGRFGDAYWLQKDRDGDYPNDFHAELTKLGWLGIAMPTEFGGSGLGIADAAILMQAISESGAAMTGAAVVHLSIFGANPVVKFGTDDQRKRMLPPLIAGTERMCFAVTEPNTGLNTLKLQTKAVRQGDHYIVSGQKVWTSSAQVADRILILVRTKPIDEISKATDGLSLFYTALDRKYVDIRRIDKMGRKAVDSNELFIDRLPVPVEDRIGEEGRGFEYILHGLNPERILLAAEAIGVGRAALCRATDYAKERIVFDRPIGMNQAIQHPLAECWMELEAANLMTFNAGALYDAGKPCGAEANAAKYLAAEAGFKACQTAVMTLGGYGYAKEFHVERYFRESLIPRIAPISPQLILCYIAEKVLGLPKSY
jgi:acyl-CoA dehydrogenase